MTETDHKSFALQLAEELNKINEANGKASARVMKGWEFWGWIMSGLVVGLTTIGGMYLTINNQLKDFKGDVGIRIEVLETRVVRNEKDFESLKSKHEKDIEFLKKKIDELHSK